MQDLYETEYGIYDHLNNTIPRPLSSVALHPSEDFNNYSLLKTAIESFVDRNILDATGLNLVEFLELPMDVVAMISEACDGKARRSSQALDMAKAASGK